MVCGASGSAGEKVVLGETGSAGVLGSAGERRGGRGGPNKVIKLIIN